MSDTATETRNGMYDDVTVHDAFAWMDTLRGWDIATHCEYEALRDAALRHHDALAKALAEARREIAYWKSVVEDPGIYWGRLGAGDDPPPYMLRGDDDLDAPADPEGDDDATHDG